MSKRLHVFLTKAVSLYVLWSVQAHQPPIKVKLTPEGPVLSVGQVCNHKLESVCDRITLTLTELSYFWPNDSQKKMKSTPCQINVN